MRKMVVYVLCVVLVLLITTICMVFAKEDDLKNIEFLNSYGWEVEEEYIERVKVEIPAVFDDVYNNYNQIQKRAGLDLSPYRGKKAIRYTYVVKNYPEDVGEQVRANVVCVGGVPVAGDIMTVQLNGFMHSLNYPEQ